jgi:tetratricopeptide (TPR) repeat protein
MVFYDHYLLLSIMLCVPLLTRVLLNMPERRRRGGIVAMAVLAVVFAGYDYQLYGHWKNRETLYQRIIAMAPRMPKGYLFLGKAYNEQGRFDEAIGVLGKIPSLEGWFPTYLEVYRELGDAYGRSGRFAEAAGAYRSYLEYQPQDRISLQNLSASLMEQHQYREALTVILQWRSYYPDDADARYNMQLCEQSLGRSGEGR